MDYTNAVAHLQAPYFEEKSTSPIREYILQVLKAMMQMSDEPIAGTISILFAAWKQRKQVFILGNGGSASAASHMANDFVNRLLSRGCRG